MRQIFRKHAMMTATALAAVLATPAMAQDAPAAEPAGPGDIIVTARRVEERLQDVPISITVYNQEQINDRNITTATELATYTPSLASNQRFGADKASFALRGFIMDETTSPTVGVYFADVVAPRATAGTASGNGAGPGQFFDLQNVQVLKGPQGTLFGRNTTGGAILLVPTKPTGDLEGYVEGSIGNYDLRRVQAVLNVPLADNFRARLGIDRQKRDGYLRNQSGIGPDDFADSNYISLRASIVGDLTPDLENYFIARYSRSDTNGFILRLAGCERDPAKRAGRAIVFAPFACNQVDRQIARGDGFYDVEGIVPDPFNILQEWQLINTTTLTASDTLTIRNIASYGEFREKFHSNIGGERLVALTGPGAGKAFASTIIRNFPGRYGAAQYTFTEELQFIGRTPDDRLNWQAGAYYEQSKPQSGGNTTMSAGGVACSDLARLQCEALIPQAFGPTVGLIQNLVSLRNIGLYAQGTYDLTEQLAITAGIRYTMDRTVGQGGRTTIAFPQPNVPTPAGCQIPALAAIRTFNPRECFGRKIVEKSKEPTWLLGLDYKPAEDILLYAKWARGYRQGGVNPSNVGLEAWNPEKVDTYEVGAKTTFRGALTGYLNVAAFYNDLTNQQISATLTGCNLALCGPNRPAGIPGARIILNAGSSRIMGVEVDASISPFEGFRLDVGYAHLDTKLKSIEQPVLDPNGPFFAITVPITAGSELQFSPKHRLTATANYELPLDESVGDVSFGATYVYTSSQIATRGNPFGIIPSSNLLNLNFDWKSVMGSTFDLAAFVTNVTREKFTLNAAGNFTGNGYESVVTNSPRMYGVRLKYRFGD